MLDLFKKIFSLFSPARRRRKKYIKYGEMLAKGFEDGCKSTPNDEARERLHRLCEALIEATKENE